MRIRQSCELRTDAVSRTTPMINSAKAMLVSDDDRRLNLHRTNCDSWRCHSDATRPGGNGSASRPTYRGTDLRATRTSVDPDYIQPTRQLIVDGDEHDVGHDD